MNDCFNLGYISSTITESSNARFKNGKSKGSFLTFSEARDLFTRVEVKSERNRYYIKNRKPRKMLSLELARVMEECNVSVPIAESICGSIEKAKALKVHNNDDNWFVSNSSNIYDNHIINKNSLLCSCKKFEQVGLPCSHIIAALPNMEIKLFAHNRCEIPIIIPIWK